MKNLTAQPIANTRRHCPLFQALIRSYKAIMSCDWRRYGGLSSLKYFGLLGHDADSAEEIWRFFCILSHGLIALKGRALSFF